MAIQISGTTVVNNSRELQNIASLDATTTATIGAAAGGATSLITDWTNISTGVSNFTISLPADYDIVRIFFEDLQVAGNDVQVYLRGRFTSSGTPQTSSAYYSALQSNTGEAELTTSYFRFGYTISDGYLNGNREGWFHGDLEVQFPKDASNYTKFFANTLGFGTISSEFNYQERVYGIYRVAQSHDGVYFFTDDGKNFSGGKYKVYGVKL